MVRVHYLGEINSPVASIKAGFHSAIEPAACFRQNGAAGRSYVESQALQLVRVPTRLQTKPPDPIYVLLIDQVESEGAALVQQTSRMVLAGKTDHHSRAVGHDTGLIDKCSDQPARGVPIARSHQPNDGIHFRPNVR